MSEAEVGSQEGGGAPLPPKRPTIIRPTQDGSRPVPTRPAPVRPAPAAPGGRPPPAVPRPPAAASGAPSPVLSKGPSGSAPSPAPTRKPDPPAKDNGKPKSQGSVRKRPEITIVDARPMNQAGLRDMTALDNTAVPKPVHKTSAVTDTSSKPSSNGSVPGIPNRPPPASMTATTSTSAPSQPRPPAPPSRPGAPHHAPPPVPGKSAMPDKPDANHSDAPPKPSRPTILRPGRPKSAVFTGETAPVQNQTSPPPPLPKRSPLMTETAVAGDLMGFDAPPKPERSPHLNNDSQGDEKIGAEDVEKGEGHVVPKKPTRVSIIRPPSRPKPVAEDGQRTAERTDEAEEASSQHPSRPKPPVPPSRPVAVVAANPRDSSPTDSPRSDDSGHAATTPPPVPSTRPKTSPRDHGSTDRKASEAEKPVGIPERPRPPVPVSRPHVSPPGGSPRLPDHPVPSKPPPPSSAAPPVPVSRPPGSSSGVLSPPLVPSKPPPLADHNAEGSLYAVSEPLEDTLDKHIEIQSSLEAQPSRPPPPVPKTRPQPAHPPSPMLGRPLPSVPSPSSVGSLSPEQGHVYEDVESVKTKRQTLVKMGHVDSGQSDKPDLSPREKGQAGEPFVVDDIDAMYAKVNKPSKQNRAQNSVEDASPIESAAPNPFGVKLKRVAPEKSPDSETLPNQRSTDSDNTDVKKPPVLAPKPKPGVQPKPQPAAKPKSPRNEATAETPLHPPDVAAKPELPTKIESSEGSKPALAAKRPTIIRPTRSAAESAEADHAAADGSEDVQMRSKGKASQSRPQSELPLNEDAKKPVAELPVPSKRPVTIIGSPHHKQKSRETEEAEKLEHTPPPVPRHRPAPTQASPKDEAKRTHEFVHKEDHTAQEKVASRPPPPRPGGPPSKHHQGQPSPLSPDSESAPLRPASPAPARPAHKPAPPREMTCSGGGAEPGGAAASSTPGITPPIKRKDSAEEREEEVDRRPTRPSGPPGRPISMPPIKAPLSAVAKQPSAANDVKSEKPGRPQPMRPAAPKDAKPASLPALPKRPGLAHPLYGYMASQPHAIAVHDYVANHHDEMSFQEGDTVVLLKRVDEEWLMGKVGDKEGMFPQNFVTIIHPLHDELPASAIDDIIDEVFDSALEEKPDLLRGPRCRARFDFDGEGHGDLAFEDGDVIQLLAHCGGDWLKGELNGKQGIFPASFVEIIEDLPEGNGNVAKPVEEGSEVTALFDFSGEHGELSFQAGDKICVQSKVNDQWLFGRCGNSEGSFPASFVDAVNLHLPLRKSSTSSQTSVHSSQQRENSDRNKHGKPKRYCTALYSFEQTQEGDLDFHEGDLIEVLEEVGNDWLKGRLAGREGVFPATFVLLEAGASASPLTGFDDTDCHTGLEMHSGLVAGRALFDFDGQADNELSFKAGDEIILGAMVSEGSEWQWGELYGKKGMFPADFVEMI